MSSALVLSEDSLVICLAKLAFGEILAELADLFLEGEPETEGALEGGALANLC